MRCLTKNLAMFGLGHYIYAGEDLPEDENKQPEPAKRIEPAKEQAKPVLLVSDKEKFEAAKSFVESSLKSGKQPFAILQEIRTRYSVPLETQISLNLSKKQKKITWVYVPGISWHITECYALAFLY